VVVTLPGAGNFAEGLLPFLPVEVLVVSAPPAGEPDPDVLLLSSEPQAANAPEASSAAMSALIRSTRGG
jgi:hypothetical protein